MSKLFPYFLLASIIINFILSAFLYIFSLKIDTLELDVHAGKINNTTLKASIKKQNKAIESQRIDYEAKLKIFQDKKPDIRTIYIDRYIRDVNMTRGNCEDVENIFNNIRDIDFD